MFGFTNSPAGYSFGGCNLAQNQKIGTIRFKILLDTKYKSTMPALALSLVHREVSLSKTLPLACEQMSRSVIVTVKCFGYQQVEMDYISTRLFTSKMYSIQTNNTLCLFVCKGQERKTSFNRYRGENILCTQLYSPTSIQSHLVVKEFGSVVLR